MTLPAAITRVSTMTAGRVGLSNLTRTNIALTRAQEQISSGRAISRVSDDSVKASIVAMLDDRLDRTGQVQRNMSHAASALGVLDSTLSEVSDLILEARSIASEQINITSSASERASQAAVVDQLLQSLFNASNRSGIAGYVFGGSVTSRAPVESVLGGYRYVGEGGGLLTDLGMTSDIPLTVGNVEILAGTSARVRGDVDLDPRLSPSTPVSDLIGARALPITLGTLALSINGNEALRIDLSQSDSMEDVIASLNGAIRQYESDTGTSVLGTGGVGINGNSLSFDALTGVTLEFSDLPTGVTAQDFGLTAGVIDNANQSGSPLDARLSFRSPVADLDGLAGPLGSLRITNAGRSAVIDLSTATTLGDIRNLIEGAQLGVRVRINDAGDGLDLVNELSGRSSQSLSVTEASLTGTTASMLGIRSLNSSTRVSELNFGRGVSIVDNVTNPLTSSLDPALNTDIQITLGNGAATRLSIDLRPQDMSSVQSVMDRINAEIQTGLAAAGLPPTALSASISPTTNGIVLTQDSSFPGTLGVTSLNNSPAAADLGLIDGQYDPASASFTGTDRAKVRVESLFTHLLDLREGLTSNSISGIQLAAQGIETAVGSIAELRGQVGSYAQRVDSAAAREEEQELMDLSVRSELRDADYAEVSVRFSLLQTQLQAGLRATAQAGSLTLLDYI